MSACLFRDPATGRTCGETKYSSPHVRHPSMVCNNLACHTFVGLPASTEAATGDGEKYRRPPGCLCTWEEGDSPCPVHAACSLCEAVISDADKEDGAHSACRIAALEAEVGRLTKELGVALAAKGHAHVALDAIEALTTVGADKPRDTRAVIKKIGDIAKRGRGNGVMRIEVTADDIANGVKTKCAECPAARAVSRAAGQPAFVGPFDIWVQGQWSVKTPQVVRKFIADYDDGLPVEPFSFDIDVAGLPQAAPVGWGR